jgi:hypothetical protein
LKYADWLSQISLEGELDLVSCVHSTNLVNQATAWF